MISVMIKKQYETPNLQFFDVRLEQTILSNVQQVQTMDNVDGDWGDDDF